MDEPKISIVLKSNEILSSDDKKTATEIVYRLFFSLKLDLRSFYEAVEKDEALSRLTQRLRGLKIPTTSSVFEALISSIIEQQISLNEAHSIKNRMVKSFGDVAKVTDEVYYAFPNPEQLVLVPMESLRKCGLSVKKAEYIKDASKFVAAKKMDLEKFRECEDAEKIIRDLVKIRGIGVWTAELTMVRGMHKLEVMPSDDLRLGRSISHYYFNNRKISSKDARRVSEKWGKWKGLAGFYVVMAKRLGIEV